MHFTFIPSLAIRAHYGGELSKLVAKHMTLVGLTPTSIYWVDLPQHEQPALNGFSQFELKQKSQHTITISSFQHHLRSLPYFPHPSQSSKFLVSVREKAGNESLT